MMLSKNLCLLIGVFRPFKFSVIFILLGLNLPLCYFLIVSYVLV